MRGLLVAAVLLILLIVVYQVYSLAQATRANQVVELPREYLDTAGYASSVKAVDQYAQQKQPPKSFMQMTDGEKVQFIIDTYFTEVNEAQPAEQKAKEDAYINSLPQDSSCQDDYDDCAKWAANGECTINPEFMLYSCAKSCQACALTPQQKNDVTVIYNNRDTPQVIYHGENYPGNFPYLNRMYSYNVHYN